MGSSFAAPPEQEQSVDYLINGAGGNIAERISPPGDYRRVDAAAGSYQQYLRDLLTELIRPKPPASVGGGFQRAVKSSMTTGAGIP